MNLGAVEGYLCEERLERWKSDRTEGRDCEKGQEVSLRETRVQQGKRLTL